MADDGDISALAQAAEQAFPKPFGAVLKLTPTEGGEVFLDGRLTPPKIASAENADCAWHGAFDVLLRARSSQRAFESAFVAGRLTVSGDISVMARLAIEGAR